MRNRVPDEATCAICGRHFDPSETRGWCPNPSCGEWQHPSFPLEGGEATGADEAEPAAADSGPTKTCPSCGEDVRADARFCKHCAHGFEAAEDPSPEPDPDPEPEPATPSDPDPPALACPDCGADLSDVPSDSLARCPICMFDLGPDFGEEADESEPAAGAEAPARCPNCGEDLTPIPPDMRTVCPGCRTDLEEAATGDEGEGEGESPPIETVDAVEAGFETRLREAGVSTLADLLEADADDLSAKTGISARRIRGWMREAGGEGPEHTPDRTPDIAESEPTVIDPGPAGPGELVLEVRGREVSVADGQAVGSEIRSAMVAAGASRQDAVYVHRKHVRVDFEDGDVYLTRLGENSLKVNGRTVGKGKRVRLDDGDEITFSDVVTATVSVR